MSWRYQPVWVDHTVAGATERVFSLCEVYFDPDGKLKSWTREPAMVPSGTEGVQDLQGTLEKMLSDARRWKPVAYASLAVGMAFERETKP